MKKPFIPFGFLYIVTLLTGVLFLPTPLEAQVDQGELGDLGPVVFINYEGPYSRIETRAQIRSIGYNLGQIIKDDNARSGAQGRYFVIHSVSDPDGSKLDADIFGLGPDVGVDHIRNLRFIIQGYLEAAYDYSESDAALLSEYITVYNAVYRGDLGYFGSRYKNPVMDNLSQEKAGLALRFDEWPGQTLILIPLGTGLGGQLSSIDTSSITDSRVTEQLRQEPDMSLDQRRDMVDLMEREADEAAQQAAIRREAIRQEEERIAREREQAQERQRQAQQEQQRIEQERQQAGANQQALDQRQQEAERQAEEAQRLEEELERQGQALEDERKEVEEQEAFADQKSAEAQQERQQIAEDMQTQLDRQPPFAQGGEGGNGNIGSIGISILNSDSALGRLVQLDNTGRVTKQSPLNTVNVKTVIQVSNRIFAIAGLAQGSGAIRIVEIDANTLEMVKQGDDDIAPESLLWANGQDIYAVTNLSGNFSLARFNTDLVLQSRSSTNVHPFASVFFYGGFIATQRSDGSAVLLDPRDLSEKR
jgi:hypothetical protein